MRRAAKNLADHLFHRNRVLGVKTVFPIGLKELYENRRITNIIRQTNQVETKYSDENK